MTQGTAMGASVQSRSGVCLTAPAGLFQNFPKAKLMRHFVFQVRNVFNMTAKEGRKKSVRVLVAVGNGNGAAGEWGWGWGWGIGRGLALLKTDSYVAGLVFPPGYIF